MIQRHTACRVSSIGTLVGCLVFTTTTSATESPVNNAVEILSQQQLKTFVGGTGCSNCNNDGGPQPTGPDDTTDDPVNLSNGDLFYEFTDFAFPTHARGRVALTRRYDAQIFSDLDNWKPDSGTGTWAIQNGVLNGQGDRCLSKNTFSDAIIELDVRTADPGADLDEQAAWINFRCTKDPTAAPSELNKIDSYYLLIRKNGVVELSRRDNGGSGPIALGVTPHSNIDPTIWNRVRIENIGSSIKVFINGVLFFDVTDTMHASGQVVLESYFSHCHFDNIVITDQVTPSNSTTEAFDDPTDNDYPFGNQWKNTYGDRLWERSNGDVVLERADGIRYEYSYNGSSYDAPPLIYDALVKNPGGDYTLTTKHQAIWSFNANGTLASITDRNSNTIALGYETKTATISPFEQAERSLLVDNFDDDSDPAHDDHNSLSLDTNDDGTLVARTAANGGLKLQWDHLTDYWYTLVARNITPSGPVTLVYADLSAYSHLSVDVKGLAGGEDFKIKLEDITGSATVDLSTYANLTTSFQTVQIPLSIFSGLNLTQMKAIVFLFNTQSAGTIEVDNLEVVDLVTPPNPPVVYSVDRLVSIKTDPGDPAEREVQLTYHTNGKVEKVILPQATLNDPQKNREYTYSYDSDGNLQSSTDPEGYQRLYEYYPNRTLKKYTNREGNAFEFEYAYNNRCLKQTDPNLKETHFRYLWEHTFVKNSDDLEWEYTFDHESHKVAKIRYPELIRPATGSLYEKSWIYYTNPTDPARNRIKSVTDQEGNTTQFTYDAQGNTETITNAKGHTTTFQYHSMFNLVERIDEDLLPLQDENPQLTRYTIFEYDPANGNLQRIKRAHTNPGVDDAEVNITQYDAHGNPEIMFDEAGHQWTRGYDHHGNMDSLTTPKSETWSQTHNNVGEVRTETTPKTEVTEFVRNDRGLVNLIIPPAPFSAHAIDYEYDGNRKMKKMTRKGIAPGQADLITQYEYDKMSRLKKVIDPMGHVTDYVNDSKNQLHLGISNLISVIDANLHTTTHLYDVWGRLEQTTDAENNVTEYKYYGNDLLEKVTVIIDPNDPSKNQVTKYKYNELNQQSEIEYADQTTDRYGYDAIGNLISQTTRKSDEILFKNDALNRRSKKIYPGGVGEIVYHYNDAGLLEQVDDLVGPNTTGVNSFVYTYDLANRLNSETDPWGRVVTNGYDANGNRDEITYPGDASVTLTNHFDELNRLKWIDDESTSTDPDYTFDYDEFDRRDLLTYPNSVTADYDYDNAHRLTSLVNKDPASQILSQYVYTPDPVGNREDRTTSTGLDDYIYDMIDRVTQVTYAGGRTVTYDLDPVGNRRSINDNGVVTPYTSNNLNQYTDVNGVPYTYNQNGSLENNGTSTFTYDIDNRLTQADVDNHALEFNGTDSYVTIPDDPTLKNNPNMTVAFWVKDLKGSGQINRILGKGYGTAQDLDYASIFWSNDHLWGYQMVDGSGQNLAQHAGVDRSNWIHFAKTLEPQPGGGFISKLYFNGQHQYTRTVSYTNLELSTYPLKLGWWAGGYFHGQLDDLAIYHRTLTETEIQNVMTNGPSNLTEVDLKAYYPFDVDTVDFQANTVQDKSIHANHGQIIGGVTQTVREVDQTITQYDYAGRRVSQTVNGVETLFASDGNEVIADFDANGNELRRYVYGPNIDEVLVIQTDANPALEFNGIDSYVTIPDDPTLKNNPNMTVAFWVKDLKGSGQINRILGKGHGTARDLDYASIFWSTDHLWGYQMVDGSGHNLAQHAAVNRNNWIHFAKTLEPQPGGGFISKLYFNGQLQNTRTVSYTNLELSTYPLNLGWWAGGYFQGQLDDVAIYHRTFTETDIQDLMTNGPSDLTEVDLKAYYPFDVDTVDFQANTVQDKSIHGNHGQIVGGVTQAVRSRLPHYLTRDGLNSVSEATDSAGQVVERYTYDIYGQPTIADSSSSPISVSTIDNRYLFTGREWSRRRDSSTTELDITIPNSESSCSLIRLGMSMGLICISMFETIPRTSSIQPDTSRRDRTENPSVLLCLVRRYQTRRSLTYPRLNQRQNYPQLHQHRAIQIGSLPKIR